MKRTLCALLALIPLFFSGCADDGGGLNILGPEGDDFAGLTMYLSEAVLYDPMDKAQKLSFPPHPEGIYFLRRLNELVEKLGFRIRFETIPNLWPSATPDKDGYKYIYMNSLEEYSYKLRGKDVGIVFTNGGLFDFLTEGDSPYVRPITLKQWQESAPQWYAVNKPLLDEDLQSVPTGYISGTVSHPVLLVCDDIAKAYSAPIGTLEEYGDFLDWCAARYPEMTPSLVTDNIQFGSYRGTVDELAALFAGELDGLPADTALYENIGMTLAYSDERGYFFRPIEQDPNFLGCVQKLLSWRDDGLIEIANLKEPIKPPEGGYASVLVPAYYWTETGLMTLKQRFCETLLPLMNETPYILYNGKIPETRADYSPMAYNVSCLGANASDRAVAEWLSFLEYLHSSRENLRSLVWGERGIEYTIEDGAYEPLPYPNPGDLDRPDAYDFRYDFRALLYFADDRYFCLNPYNIDTIPLVKSADMGKAQPALDNLDIPVTDQSVILRSVPQNTLWRMTLDAHSSIAKALNRREEAFRKFLDELITVPARDTEVFIKRFADAQQADCDTLSVFYAEAFHLGDWQAQKTDDANG